MLRFFCQMIGSAAVLFIESAAFFFCQMIGNAAVFCSSSLRVLRFFCQMIGSAAVYFSNSLRVLRFFLPNHWQRCGFFQFIENAAVFFAK